MIIAIAIGVILAFAAIAVFRSAARVPGEMAGMAVQDLQERAALKAAIVNGSDPATAEQAARELAARDSFNKIALLVVVLGVIGACVWAVVSNMEHPVEIQAR